MKKMKSIAILGLAFTLLVGGVLTGCGSKEASSDEKVILYTNADDEAIAAMQNALDSNGYKDKYIVQTFGTSELGGKLLAEGADKWLCQHAAILPGGSKCLRRQFQSTAREADRAAGPYRS